mmetsp:Transcript_30038/g.45553  ORF Transcript_30038/g.45553 Transcript_30038/m.45553 type:complete len:174 (-) Transcript_30038:175-696(-)
MQMEKRKQTHRTIPKPLEENKEEPLCSTRDAAKTSIHSLPDDAVALILRNCPDMNTLMNVASASPVIRRTMYHQLLLTCYRCQTHLFSDENLSEPAFQTKAFSCSVCHEKLCGYTRYDYDRRKCKPQICDACGKIECMRCMESHFTDEQADVYGTENYCEDCQAAFEFGMGGC